MKGDELITFQTSHFNRKFLFQINPEPRSLFFNSGNVRNKIVMSSEFFVKDFTYPSYIEIEGIVLFPILFVDGHINFFIKTKLIFVFCCPNSTRNPNFSILSILTGRDLNRVKSKL